MTKGKKTSHCFLVKEILVNDERSAGGDVDVDGGDRTTKQPAFHLINCKLAESKPDMQIDQFFASQLKFGSKVESVGVEKKQPSANQVMKVSFRGRPLNGKRVQLPENYAFAQLSKSENSNQLIAGDLSRLLTYWNLDKLPSGSDPVPQMVQWLKLSADIHSHVQLD